MAIYEGSFERVCVQNFSAYLDKIGVSEAKKKIALNANLFRQIITFQKEQQIVKIVTQIQYGVDLGLTTTETWYSIQNLDPYLTFLNNRNFDEIIFYVLVPYTKEVLGLRKVLICFEI